MSKSINVGMIGYKFMGKAHSHAYRDVAMFFETETIPVMKVICGRTEQLLLKQQKGLAGKAMKPPGKKLFKEMILTS